MSMVDILQKEFMSSELYRINKIKILYETNTNNTN
jgi:hypothetical protein